LFDRCEKLSRDDVDAWLVERDGGATEASVAGTANVRASVDPKQFNDAIDAIHAALRAGDSYQVNYTYRLGFDVFGSPTALYRRLRVRQPVPYGALIALPGDTWVLSCSPELFIEKDGAMLRARPMKGTAPRSADPVADRHAAEFLANDPKNRAENVMIVDLLRNDLSRVAQTGSVHVPALFFGRTVCVGLANDLYGAFDAARRHDFRRDCARAVSLRFDHRCAEASHDAIDRRARKHAAWTLHWRDRLARCALDDQRRKHLRRLLPICGDPHVDLKPGRAGG
jgi:Anthranilate/para-aminobenzoate synthases component I